MDDTADGRVALVSCEFAGRAIVVDLRRERVVRTIDLRPGAMPQDVKLSPDGRTFLRRGHGLQWRVVDRRAKLAPRALRTHRQRRARPVPEL
jgi:hypothetical protein